MNGSDFLTAQLALKGWQDGRTEGGSGMRAVCFAIRNRVRAGFYGGDWSQILSHHQEWSATLEPPTTEIPDPREPAFRALLQDVTGIFSGSLEDNITIMPGSALAVAPPVALYYGFLNQISNPWFLEEISRKFDSHKRVAQVGALTFFS